MIRRFWEWVKEWWNRRQTIEALPHGTDEWKDYRRRQAQRANICLARHTAMKHERLNAYRTLEIVDADLRYLRGD